MPHLFLLASAHAAWPVCVVVEALRCRHVFVLHATSPGLFLSPSPYSKLVLFSFWCHERTHERLSPSTPKIFPAPKKDGTPYVLYVLYIWRPMLNRNEFGPIEAATRAPPMYDTASLFPDIYIARTEEHVVRAHAQYRSGNERDPPAGWIHPKCLRKRPIVSCSLSDMLASCNALEAVFAAEAPSKIIHGRNHVMFFPSKRPRGFPRKLSRPEGVCCAEVHSLVVILNSMTLPPSRTLRPVLLRG